MLKNMRKQFKRYSWTLWLVIIAFLIGFSFFDAFQRDLRSESDLVSIGNQVISGDEYYTKLMKTIEGYSNMFNRKIDKSFILQRRIPEEVLQRLVAMKVILNEAKNFKMTVSDEELSESIKNYSQVYYDKDKGQVRYFPFREYGTPDGRFVGLREYQAWIARNRMKVSEFEDQQREALILEKFMALVSEPLVIDQETLRQKYREENDSVNLDFIAVKPERIEQTIPVSAEEIKTYYEKNKENYKTEEKRSGLVVALKFEDFDKKVVVTDKEIFDYYRENKDQFRTQAKTKVSRFFLKYDEKNRDQVYKEAELIQQQLTPENFAQQAIARSQGTKAKQGGDWGYTGWQNFTDQEKTFIEGLDEKGISPVIDTRQGGFSIVFVTEKVHQSQKPLDDVKEGIKANLKSGRLNKLVEGKMNEIYSKLKDAKDIKAKAAELKLETIETGLLANNDPIAELDASGYISRSLFSLEEEGKISLPFNFIKGLAIVQLTQTVAPEIEALENVKDQVKTEVETAKKLELLTTESEQIAEHLNTLKDEAAIKKYLEDKKLEAVNVTYKRGNRLSYLPLKDGLDDTIFGLKENIYAPPIAFEKQAVIVKVKSRKISTDIDFEKDKVAFYQQKIQEARSLFFNSYLTQVQQKYKTKFNTQLFQRVKDQVVERFN